MSDHGTATATRREREMVAPWCFLGEGALGWVMGDGCAVGLHWGERGGRGVNQPTRLNLFVTAVLLRLVLYPDVAADPDGDVPGLETHESQAKPAYNLPYRNVFLRVCVCVCLSVCILCHHMSLFWTPSSTFRRVMDE